MTELFTEFRLPNGTQRHAIMGHTGSGKTHLATWALSHANWHRQPWVIVDFKGEDFFAQLERETFHGLTEIGIDKKVPKKPGLYIVRPLPAETESEKEKLNDFLWNIWQRENTGVFVDEAHMMPRRGAFPALLTQGRSKHIPMIVVTQKPSWVSQFVFSEADFFSVFHLNDWRDRQRVMEFVPADLSKDMPEHYSHWHDVSKRLTLPLAPVPDRGSIVDRFKRRLEDTKSRGKTWNGFTKTWNGFTSLGQSKTGSRWF